MSFLKTYWRQLLLGVSILFILVFIVNSFFFSGSNNDFEIQRYKSQNETYKARLAEREDDIEAMYIENERLSRSNEALRVENRSLARKYVASKAVVDKISLELDALKHKRNSIKSNKSLTNEELDNRLFYKLHNIVPSTGTER